MLDIQHFMIHEGSIYSNYYNYYCNIQMTIYDNTLYSAFSVCCQMNRKPNWLQDQHHNITMYIHMNSLFNQKYRLCH